MKKLDEKTEQFLLRNLCTRMKKYKNSLFLFIFFLCRVTHVEQNLKEMNFCCWNSWFPFSSCFSSSYIDFEIHDFLFLPAFLHHTLTLKFMISFFFLLFFIIHWLWKDSNSKMTFLIIQCRKPVARRQNSKVLAIPKCGVFSKVQEIWRILFRFIQSPVLLTAQNRQTTLWKCQE